MLHVTTSETIGQSSLEATKTDATTSKISETLAMPSEFDRMLTGSAEEQKPQDSSLAWIQQDELDQKSWQTAASKLGAMGGETQRWIAACLRDNIASGRASYPKAAGASIDAASQQDMACVASQFEASLRSVNLTWCRRSIHKPVGNAEARTTLNTTSRTEVDEPR